MEKNRVVKDDAHWVLLGFDMSRNEEIIYAQFHCSMGDISEYLSALLNRDEELKRNFVAGCIRVYRNCPFEVGDIDVKVKGSTV
jgi:hypothetical protein